MDSIERDLDEVFGSILQKTNMNVECRVRIRLSISKRLQFIAHLEILKKIIILLFFLKKLSL